MASTPLANQWEALEEHASGEITVDHYASGAPSGDFLHQVEHQPVSPLGQPTALRGEQLVRVVAVEEHVPAAAPEYRHWERHLVYDVVVETAAEHNYPKCTQELPDVRAKGYSFAMT